MRDCTYLFIVVTVAFALGCNEPGGGFTIGDDTDCNGGVWQGGVDVHDESGLAALEGYTEITGDLEISNSSLPNLDSLGCLVRVGGELSVVNNSVLTDIDGLQGVEEIGGGLKIESCGSITGFAMDQLVSLGGYLSIGDNGSLESFTMSSLGSTGDRLTIGDNHVMSDFDLSALASVEGFVSVEGNDLLDSLGLESLDQIAGSLWITDNSYLPTCLAIDLEDQLSTIVDGVCIRDNMADSCEDDLTGC